MTSADTDLVELARAGDPRAFDELAAIYRSELRAHCYRMLGSVHDADDALQDAMLRAWKAIGDFAGRGTVRAWLYSIATNCALDLATRRARRELPVDLSPSAGPDTELDPPSVEIPWLEPYPDRWLTSGSQSHAASPDALFEQRESIELAFVVALQRLPPLQRAVLLLREVVGYSTTEISGQLSVSPQSVNSALQRARATVRGLRPETSQQATQRNLGEQRTREIAQRYADAIERADVAALISMLTEDATWSMPPIATYYRGHEAVAAFLSRYPLRETWRHRTTHSNGQLAIGAYRYRADADMFVPAVVDVLTLTDDGRISAVTAFLAAEDLDEAYEGRWVAGEELFRWFGLPVSPP